MAGACGTCTTCCKMLGIEELKKPVNKWCSHCDIGRGCGIYEDRPHSCQIYKCLWLETQTGPNQLPKNLRPDNTGCVFTVFKDDPTIIFLHTTPDKRDVWRQRPVVNLISAIVTQKRQVVVSWDTGPDKIVLRLGIGDTIIQSRVKEVFSEKLGRAILDFEAREKSQDINFLGAIPRMNPSNDVS